MTASAHAGEVLAELRRLADRFPVPHPWWHRYVPAMRRVVADLGAAIEAIEALPDAQAEVVSQVEGAAGHPPDDAGGPAIAAAWARLRELPVPEGEHPYLDEILVTLDAAEAALAALASTDGGEAAFAARV